MKRAVIQGDMGADRASEQYPTVNLCDACYESREVAREDSGIVQAGGDYDPALGACADCGVTAEEEACA